MNLGYKYRADTRRGVDYSKSNTLTCEDGAINKDGSVESEGNPDGVLVLNGRSKRMF